MKWSFPEAILQPDPAHHACKNCQTPFQGHYCPLCGQAAKDYERPLRFLIIDFAGNVFAFDTRVWRTLITLLINPGRMETHYTQGKRARYMPPFRMYIFMSFLFFLLLSYYTNRSLEQNKSAFSTALTQAGYPANPQAADLQQKDHPRQLSFPEGSYVGNPASAVVANIRHILENPGMFLTRFFKYLSWALFLLMPIYAFFLWVMFRKSRKYYLSHFLLSANQHVFVFMILIIMILIQLVFPHKTRAPEAYLLYLVPAYSMAGAFRLYQKSWIATILRLAIAQLVYALVAALTTGMVVYFSFFG